MKRSLLVFSLLLSGLLSAPPATAAPSRVAEATTLCQTGFATYGFSNVGGCVSFVARGGQLVPAGPAQLVLTFEHTTTCYNGFTPTYGCLWSVAGSGLQPGSQVTVGEAQVSFGATIPVDASGSVLARGIYFAGACVTLGFESQVFIARGTAADGSPVESAVVTGNVLEFTPLCL